MSPGAIAFGMVLILSPASAATPAEVAGQSVAGRPIEGSGMTLAQVDMLKCNVLCPGVRCPAGCPDNRAKDDAPITVDDGPGKGESRGKKAPTPGQDKRDRGPVVKDSPAGKK